MVGQGQDMAIEPPLLTREDGLGEGLEVVVAHPPWSPAEEGRGAGIRDKKAPVAVGEAKVRQLDALHYPYRLYLLMAPVEPGRIAQRED
jgi:hypothetical protein